MTNSQCPTGTYVKGDVERVAQTASDAVALRFKGFKLKTEDTSEAKPAAVTPADLLDSEKLSSQPAQPRTFNAWPAAPTDKDLS